MLKFLRKFPSRFLLWLRVLRIFKGLTFKSVMNIWLSAFVDSFLHAFSRTTPNPKLILEGIYFYKVDGVGLAVVRGGTDDFYHMIPERERDVEQIIKTCLREGSVFVDVGANVGYYTLIASKLVGPHGCVYSIEPIPSTVAILRANTKLNNCRNVNMYNVAAWSFRGTLSLKVPSKCYGYASVFRNGTNVVVDAMTLDEILRNEDSIDCIKIDVEGAELEVLWGAKGTLKRTKFLVIEVTRNVKEVLKQLKEAEFECRRTRITSYIFCKRV